MFLFIYTYPVFFFLSVFNHRFVSLLFDGKKNLEWPGLVVPPPHCGGRSGAVVSAPGGSRQLDFSAPRKTDLVVNQKTNGFDKFLFLVSNKILSRHLYQLFPLRFVCTWRRMAASPDGVKKGSKPCFTIGATVLLMIIDSQDHCQDM